MTIKYKLSAGILLFFIFLLYETYVFNWWSANEKINYLLIGAAFCTSLLIKIFRINPIICLICIFILFAINLIGLSPILTIGLMWFIARAIGIRILNVLNQYDLNERLYSTAIGFAIIGTFISILSHFKINYFIVYLLLFVATFIYLRRYKNCFNFNLDEVNIFDSINIIPIFIFTMVAIYLYLATMQPDMSHDGLSTHLVIPRKIYENHIWDYDFNDYIWALLPMGAEFLYTPAYFFGSEDAVRLLNTTFLIATSYLIFRKSIDYKNSINISMGMALMLLSLPLSFYVVGSTFVEPVAIFYTTFALMYLLEKGPNLIICGILFGFLCTLRISLVIFLPFILIFLVYKNNIRSIQDFIKISLVLFLFGFINYCYSYWITGNPFFPLFNHIFKSEYFELGVNYNNHWANKDGLMSVVLSTLNSKNYSDTSSNGTIGLFTLLMLPFVSLLFFIKDLKSKSYLFIFILIIIFCSSIISVQAYLRYVYPVFGVFFIISSFIISKKYFNELLILSITYILILINVYKIPYAGTNLIFHHPQIFIDNSARKKFFSKEMPYAYMGEIIKEFPQIEGKRILLLGPGFTPSYYNYPDKMIAFSWHSRNAFNVIIRELEVDKQKGLHKALNKLNVEYIVCPEIQGNTDDFLDINKSTEQCKASSEKVFIFNGVYLGKVKSL